MTQSTSLPADSSDSNPIPKPLPETTPDLVSALLAKMTLPASQINAIEAIMDGNPPPAAAHAAKVHRSTLYRWMKEDPAFAGALAECRAAVRFTVQDSLLAMTDDCIDVVEQAIHKGNAMVALRLLKLMGIFNFVSTIDPSAVVKAMQMRRRGDLS